MDLNGALEKIEDNSMFISLLVTRGNEGKALK
ncbi:hypothetical protein EXIGUO9Y_360053 [Exiguobacterium oxidotolerans]|uniref:Uncharacterized protein n=1 Tax=Exiguobacterium oxidotolerans TaxID=223958 RepID=A0A653IFW0_9BACL|nr:hypothetical protein EXIGUO9Y_360053 [Exiguobacterium oxidotolerans]